MQQAPGGCISLTPVLAGAARATRRLENSLSPGNGFCQSTEGTSTQDSQEASVGPELLGCCQALCGGDPGVSAYVVIAVIKVPSTCGHDQSF